jgi:hypothetical protein
MTSPGHVFVVHGSLTNMVCDLALIPTDRSLSVRTTWGRYSPRNKDGPGVSDVAATKAAFAAGARVGELLRLPPRPPFRYVDVGRGGGLLEGQNRDRELRWLEEGLEQALTLSAQDAVAGLGSRRERPLVALPVFGTDGGGFDKVRGKATASLLRHCETAVEDGSFDIAIVCLNRSDFAFLQHERKGPGGLDLLAGEQRCAETLGQAARSGGLSLFLGAGVSMAAGLPDYPTLVARMAQHLGVPEAPRTAQEAAEAAERLHANVGEDRFKQAAASALAASGASLLHSLLASTRSAEVMTTNFDELYEESAKVAYTPRRPDVLPWHRHRRLPWLLKMHGSVGHPGELVGTAGQLAHFNDAAAPLASVVQAQLLTREVLFVGYSMQDPNVVQLASAVKDYLELTRQRVLTVGTVLALEPLGLRAEALADALDVVDLGRGASAVTAASARRLEIFCDLLLWHCTRLEPAWQLDVRYQREGEDQCLRDQLRAMDVPDDEIWQPLRDLLAGYGLRTDPASAPPA